MGARRSLVWARWGVVRLKPARGDGHWESPEASSWEFLGAQVPRLPTTTRAGCPLSSLKERRHPACFPRPSRQVACAPVASSGQEYFTMPTSRVSKRYLPKISRDATRYRCSRPEASGGMHAVGPGPSQRLAGKTFEPVKVAKSLIHAASFSFLGLPEPRPQPASHGCRGTTCIQQGACLIGGGSAQARMASKCAAQILRHKREVADLSAPSGKRCPLRMRIGAGVEGVWKLASGAGPGAARHQRYLHK